MIGVQIGAGADKLSSTQTNIVGADQSKCESPKGRFRLPMATLSVRPALFVGSSSEGVEFARAVRAGLERDAEVTVWEEGVFELGQTTIESLTAALGQFDFAVLILTPDDVVRSRSKETSGPRDNVIFELGLFMGKIGRGRTFILKQSDFDLKFPICMPNSFDLERFVIAQNAVYAQNSSVYAEAVSELREGMKAG